MQIKISTFFTLLFDKGVLESLYPLLYHKLILIWITPTHFLQCRGIVNGLKFVYLFWLTLECYTSFGYQPLECTVIPIFGTNHSNEILIFGTSHSNVIPIFGTSHSDAIPIFGTSHSNAIPIFGTSKSNVIPITKCKISRIVIAIPFLFPTDGLLHCNIFYYEQIRWHWNLNLNKSKV